MGFKNDDRCLDKVADDEPIFVLRAQDKFAPALVRLWVEMARATGCDDARLQEALDHADLMDAWPIRKYPD